MTRATRELAGDVTPGRNIEVDVPPRPAAHPLSSARQTCTACGGWCLLREMTFNGGLNAGARCIDRRGCSERLRRRERAEWEAENGHRPDVTRRIEEADEERRSLDREWLEGRE